MLRFLNLLRRPGLADNTTPPKGSKTHAVAPALTENASRAPVWGVTLAALLAAALLLGKALDLALFDGAGLELRLALVAAVALGFAAARINPFRMASAEELSGAARGRSA